MMCNMLTNSHGLIDLVCFVCVILFYLTNFLCRGVNFGVIN